MQKCDAKILLSVYKSNMTIVSFQLKSNVYIWSPRRFNVEITSKNK